MSGLIERLMLEHPDMVAVEPDDVSWLAEQLCAWPVRRVDETRTMSDGYLRPASALTMLSQAARITALEAENERLRERISQAAEYIKRPKPKPYVGPNQALGGPHDAD